MGSALLEVFESYFHSLVMLPPIGRPKPTHYRQIPPLPSLSFPYPPYSQPSTAPPYNLGCASFASVLCPVKFTPPSCAVTVPLLFNALNLVPLANGSPSSLSRM